MARAQTDRRIRLLVGFAAGSSVDIIARLLAEQINKAQGLTMIVENLPGAGTLIATETAARAAADGNTLLITSPPFVINSHLRKLNYDALTSFSRFATSCIRRRFSSSTMHHPTGRLPI
jgi:tripartite-type tricarboxylate transporter receptor subunit TctC